MTKLNIADNIIRLRRQRGITQEQLADFIGVTKASVSKWETRQSTPDITLLPQLAAFFDISVDTLLGYEPQLDKEQIEKIYHRLARDFTSHPFEQVMAQSRLLAKQYYSCYPFLFQLCVLWVNHMPLAPTKEEMAKTQASIAQLCNRILSSCSDIGICSDTKILKANIDLITGNVKEAALSLEELLQPQRLSQQSDNLLIQAYVMSGEPQKAQAFAQISIYCHLLSLIGSMTGLLTLPGQDPASCQETIQRGQAIIDNWKLDTLHPNLTIQFYYHSALFYAASQETKKAVQSLKKCTCCLEKLLEKSEITLHGDKYFNRIEACFEEMGVDKNAPRDRELVLKDIRHLYDHPAFSLLEKDMEFQRLKNKLMEMK